MKAKALILSSAILFDAGYTSAKQQKLTVDGDTFVINNFVDTNGMDHLAKYARVVLNDETEGKEGPFFLYPRAYHGAQAMLEDAGQYLDELAELQEKYTDKGLEKEA